jgi:hypothetical protein
VIESFNRFGTYFANLSCEKECGVWKGNERLGRSGGGF